MSSKSRAGSRDDDRHVMADDRDHRRDASNERLAALLEQEREHPERVAALLGVNAFLIVAGIAILVAWAVLP